MRAEAAVGLSQIQSGQRLVAIGTTSVRVLESLPRPLPAEMLKAKFDNCAARALSADNVTRLYAAIQDFEHAQDVREIAALAAGMGGPKRVAA